MKLDEISHRAIKKAVEEVLQENEWPIHETYDDAGLPASSYIKFASQVVTKLRHNSERRSR